MMAMIRKTGMTVTGLLLGLNLLLAQTAVTGAAEIAQFKQAVATAAIAVQNIKTDFVQTKSLGFLDEKVVSSGLFYYAREKKIRWEYQKPYAFSFIINDNKAWMLNKSAKTEMDTRSNKMFRELSELMLFGIGGAELFDSPKFAFSFATSTEAWLVTLEPKEKEIKKLYSYIRISFSKKDLQVVGIFMQEASGDSTDIVFTNRKINTDVPETLFRAD